MWSYPGVDGGIRDLLMKKCNLDQLPEEGGERKEEVDVLTYSFGHFFQVWYYLLNFRVSSETTTLPKVNNIDDTVDLGFKKCPLSSGNFL